MKVAEVSSGHSLYLSR